jgi:hypothetical protein
MRDLAALRLVERLGVGMILATGALAAYIFIGWFWCSIYVLVSILSFAAWNWVDLGASASYGHVFLAQSAVLVSLLITYGEMLGFHFPLEFRQTFPSLASNSPRFDEYVFVISFPLTMMSVFMSSAAFSVTAYNSVVFFVLCFSAIWSVVLALLLYGTSIAAGELLPGAWSCIIPLIVGLAVLSKVVIAQRRQA